VPLPDGNRTDDRPSAPEPAAPAEDHDTALVVRQALADLPAEQRAAIVLVDIQGYPVAEAAEMLGVAEGTIKSRCARGRARMALALSSLRGTRPQGDGGHPGPGNQQAAQTVSSGPGAGRPLPTSGEGRDKT
jgi:RNA polymerase sigma-70 factor (ECF subfamily)